MQPREQSARICALQATPVFGGLRADILASLVAGARTVTVPEGAYFFREGDRAESMYVLEAGEVALFKRWAGEDFLLGNKGPGDCFGEMALLDLFPRSASVRALAACTGIELTTASFQKLYESDVEQFALVQMNIARELSRRLRVADERLFRTRVGALRLEPEPGLPLT